MDAVTSLKHPSNSPSGHALPNAGHPHFLLAAALRKTAQVDDLNRNMIGQTPLISGGYLGIERFRDPSAHVDGQLLFADEAFIEAAALPVEQGFFQHGQGEPVRAAIRRRSDTG